MDGVEPELVGARAAKVDLVGGGQVAVSGVCGGGKVARAVVPEADMIEVFDVEGGFDDVGSLVDDFVGYGVGGEVDDGRIDVDVGGVGSEEVEAVVEVVVFVCTSQAHYDQADQGGDGQGHGREDAGEAASFSHGCGVDV